ncbi:hypothetical protein [Sphingomonas faeni]|uniref:hypothetical protein n=1 Tax=Sphingomonas faeni TaxID=185950 RepID=UPI00277D4E4D|nr:hypothetical protein [Sphingomonas faeni]MDQ0836244.1 hypothetical protein [Sphingomonas faeni]
MGRPTTGIAAQASSPIISNEPGTEAFLPEFRACNDGVSAPEIEAGANHAAVGTFDDLRSRYYRYPDFLDPGERTRVVYRCTAERWRARSRKGRRYGEIMVRELSPRHVEAMLAELFPHRDVGEHAAQTALGAMKFAMRIGMAGTNAVIVTRPFEVSGGGLHSWTEEEIAAYEQHHAIGTVARLAFDLMIWTGQRGGDARKMGPASVQDTRLELTREKTKVFVSLPIMPGLAESIPAAPAVGAIS